MGEMWKKQKRPGLLQFKPKRMGRFTWDCGVWRVPKQNPWAKCNSKQNALGLLHLEPGRGSPDAEGPVRFALNCVWPTRFGLPGLLAWLTCLTCLPGLPAWSTCLACLLGLPAWPACLVCLPGLPGLTSLPGLPAWTVCLICLPGWPACLPGLLAWPACQPLKQEVVHCKILPSRIVPKMAPNRKLGLGFYVSF